MRIRDYYLKDFRRDLSCFMKGSSVPYFGHSWEHDCGGIEKVPIEKLHYDPDVQIPEIFPMLDDKVKDNVDYIAYRYLVKAVEKLK